MDDSELADFVATIEERISPNKPIPYLGWFFQDGNDDGLYRLSKSEGRIGIDNRWKFDPSIVINAEQTHKVRQLILKLLAAHEELLRYLDTFEPVFEAEEKKWPSKETATAKKR